MTPEAPKVSVIIPFHNACKYLESAVLSVLNQTFSDFELILIDDGSTDGGSSVLQAVSDSRIRFYRNEKNVGIPAARNQGIQYANGEYLAWLDGDDLSLPDRIQKQVALFDRNPNLGLCGTSVKTLGAHTDVEWHYPTCSKFLRCRMLFDNPFTTSSIMMRAEALKNENMRFDTSFAVAEDYDLWERISRNWETTNIQEVLTRYRIHATQSTAGKEKISQERVWEIQSRLLQGLGINACETEKKLHLEIGVGWKFPTKEAGFDTVDRWLLKLLNANLVRKYFDFEKFKEALAERWLLAANSAPSKKGLFEKARFFFKKRNWL